MVNYVEKYLGAYDLLMHRCFRTVVHWEDSDVRNSCVVALKSQNPKNLGYSFWARYLPGVNQYSPIGVNQCGSIDFRGATPIFTS